MATAAVSNVSIFQEIRNFYQDRRSDLGQLSSALQGGDLNAAQQAYNELVSLGQGGPFSNAEPFSRSDRASDFEAIGQALQAGDLAGAQTAFANLQDTFGHHHGNVSRQLPAFLVNLSGSQNGSGTGNVSDAESIFQQLQTFRDQRKTDLQQLGTALHAGDVNAAQQAYDTLVALGQNGPFRTSEPFRRADRAQDFAAIGQALQNGDLESAQQAFTALANTFGQHASEYGLAQPPPTIIINVGGTPGGGNLPPQPPQTSPPIGPPPTTLPPVSTLPPVTPPPTPLPPTPAPQTEPPITPGGSMVPPELIINVGGSTTPTGNTPEIVVNLGNGSAANGNPEEVQINFGNNGSSGQLTIDVNPPHGGNSGEEISINFNPGNTNYQLVLNLFDSLSSSQSQSTLSLHA